MSWCDHDEVDSARLQANIAVCLEELRGANQWDMKYEEPRNELYRHKYQESQGLWGAIQYKDVILPGNPIVEIRWS